MVKNEHLSKDRELILGELIQKRVKALEKINRGRVRSEKTISQLNEDIRQGEQAIAELVQANIGLVWDRARFFKSRYPAAPDIEDLVSMGMIGLMTAVHKYDPTRENKFSTVAFYWIAQSIGREVNKTSRLVRLPENRISDYSKMNSVINKYVEDDLTFSELDERISEELDLSKVEIINIRNAAIGHSSLNKKVGNASSGDTQKELMDIIGESHHVTGVEAAISTSECFTILQDEISKLEPLKQEIIAAQFKLQFNGEMLNPHETRDKHQLSASKYRRILSQAMIELKTALSSNDLNLMDFIEG